MFAGVPAQELFRDAVRQHAHRAGRLQVRLSFGVLPSWPLVCCRACVACVRLVLRLVLRGAWQLPCLDASIRNWLRFRHLASRRRSASLLRSFFCCAVRCRPRCKGASARPRCCTSSRTTTSSASATTSTKYVLVCCCVAACFARSCRVLCCCFAGSSAPRPPSMRSAWRVRGVSCSSASRPPRSYLRCCCCVRVLQGEAPGSVRIQPVAVSPSRNDTDDDEKLEL